MTEAIDTLNFENKSEFHNGFELIIGIRFQLSLKREIRINYQVKSDVNSINIALILSDFFLFLQKEN